MPDTTISESSKKLLDEKLSVFHEQFAQYARYKRAKLASEISRKGLIEQGKAIQMADKLEKDLVIERFRGFSDANGDRIKGLRDILVNHFETFPKQLTEKVIKKYYNQINQGWTRQINNLKAQKSEKQASLIEHEYYSILITEWRVIEVILKEMILKNKKGNNLPTKIFISHSTLDIKYVEGIVNLFKDVGVPSDIIFCSSVAGHKFPVGVNFHQFIKESIINKPIFICLLSSHFYQSTICQNEKGAAWGNDCEIIPIIIPPFTYEQIDDTIKHLQAINILDIDDLNELLKKFRDCFIKDINTAQNLELIIKDFISTVQTLHKIDIAPRIDEMDLIKNMFNIIREHHTSIISTIKAYELLKEKYKEYRQFPDLVKIYDILRKLEEEGKIKSIPVDGATKLEVIHWRALM